MSVSIRANEICKKILSSLKNRKRTIHNGHHLSEEKIAVAGVLLGLAQANATMMSEGEQRAALDLGHAIATQIIDQETGETDSPIVASNGQPYRSKAVDRVVKKIMGGIKN